MQEILVNILIVLGIIALVLVIAILVRVWIFTNSLENARKFVEEVYNKKKETLTQITAGLTALGVLEGLRKILRRPKDSMPR